MGILLIFSVDELCLLYSQSHKKIRTVKKKKGGNYKQRNGVHVLF